MTDQELETLTDDLRKYLDEQGRQRPKKRSRKGLFSKLIVMLCLILAVGYTGVCLLMQWMRWLKSVHKLR